MDTGTQLFLFLFDNDYLTIFVSKIDNDVLVKPNSGLAKV